MFNVANEEALLRKFITHVQVRNISKLIFYFLQEFSQELKPHVIVTYNGDKFDWPYVEVRCSKYRGINLYSSMGIKCQRSKNCLSPYR